MSQRYGASLASPYIDRKKAEPEKAKLPNAVKELPATVVVPKKVEEKKDATKEPGK